MGELVQQVSNSGLINTLKNSLYVGATDESVGMVIAYCQEAKLDVMLKPVHIVPMSVKDPKSGQYNFRDVIMPGIGLYRIQASRSFGYAGIDEPVFGKEVTEALDGVSVTYPEWCKVTVKRDIGNGVLADFTAKEFWKENYATKSKNSLAPNKMWLKRPYGQLGKCSEAQALRKAFPEVGQAPTAEEMEGKSYANDSDTHPVKELPPQTMASGVFEVYLSKHGGKVADGSKSPEDLINWLESKCKLNDDQKMEVIALKEIKHEDA